MDDAPRLRALIEASVRRLQLGDYTQAQIDGALGTALGLDTQLILDRHYFVAEADGELVACGGWSDRRTLFGSDGAAVREDSDRLDPAVDAARIRAIFVHPDWARRGLGSRVLECVEDAARAAGFRRFEMGSTLTGVALYRLRGYQPGELLQVPLPNGESLPVLRMTKSAEDATAADGVCSESGA
jgi:GNAT superfamily N-acetyltransferase